jgi:hypothetical protein
MSDRLTGPDQKVKRAKHHIEELAVEATGFLNGGGYEVFSDYDSEPGRRLDRVRVIQVASPELACVLGDVVHNLKSALDLVAWQAVEAGGGTPGRDTGFPICQSPNDFKATGLAKVEGASEESLDVIRRAKPYKGGNDSLWRLHHLDRFDKHRLLAVVGAAHQYTSIDMSGFMRQEFPELTDLPEMRIGINPADKLFPLEDGEVLYETDAEAKENPEHALFVAFGQGEIAESEPIMESVAEMLQSVESVLEAFRPIL